MTDIFLQIRLMTPELVLALGGMMVLIIGLFTSSQRLPVVLSGLVMIVTLFALYMQTYLPTSAIFFHQLDISIMPQGLKCLLIATAIMVLVITGRALPSYGLGRFEFPVLMIFSLLGMFIMLSAHNWLLFYLGLELQSLAIYVLAAFARNDLKSGEAAAKYFILGALASGFILFGISYVYGATGSLTYGAPVSYDAGFAVGMAFILAGVAFKLSLAPFHMWTPDVYDGVPMPVTAYLGLVPKIAALGALLQMLLWAFPHYAGQAGVILMGVALLSMAVGSFAGLRQENIKRLLGYSTIANVGTLVLGLAVLSDFGAMASLNYMFIYVILSGIIFAGLMGLEKGIDPIEKIDDLAGLGKTHPFIAWSITAALFGLAGIPPFAGFFAKFDVFRAVVGAGFTPVAILGIVFSVVSAAYYLRLIKVMFFDAAPEEPLTDQPCLARKAVTLLLLLLLGLLVVIPDFILDFVAYLYPTAS